MLTTHLKLRIVWLFICLAGIGNISFAQSYCHSESNTPFSFLTSPTVLTENSVWDDSKFMIPIGFDFLFQGTLYNKLTVESNGRIYFSEVLGENDDPTITIFGGVASEVDMIDRGYASGIALSPISYQLFENTADTFLVIEYKNVGFYKDQPDLSDSISFQLKLYRNNGKIEIHIGPHKIIADNSFYSSGVAIGLGNPTEDNGYFLTGDPASPIASKYLHPLDAVPDEGMLYTFVPVLPHPTIRIESDPIDGCFEASANYTFTATVSNESAPYLQWMKNGVVVADENELTFVAGPLTINDTITCTMTLSAACPSALPVTSNKILVSRPIATISISTTSSTICAGESLLFKAAVEHEGEDPIFKWIKNSDTVTTTSPEYWVTTPTDQDTIRCLLISNERCVADAEVLSDFIILTVLPTVTPLVSIAASKDSICAGDSILYEATPTMGGPEPYYRWTKNGHSIGENVASLYFKDLNDQDIIRCEITSSLACATGTALSNEHLAIVRAHVSTGISIAANITELCAGQSVTLTATPVNGGSTPTYLWQNNGNNIGSNNPVLSSVSFADNDSIVCILTSSLFCSNSSTSNPIKLVVHPLVTPSVVIAPSKDSICAGESLLFAATPANVSSATYQWKVNGNNAGTNSLLFSSSTLSNHDEVSCIMTPGAGCYSLASATSNTVEARIIDFENASVTIVSDATTVCTVTTVSFTATATYGGTSPVFQWYKNGLPVGANSPTYQASGFVSTDQVSCAMTSDKYCINNSPATSNSIVMTVIAAPTSTITITSSQNPICQGGSITFQATTNGIANPVYQWQLNHSNIGLNSPSFTAAGFSNNDEILCKITNSIDCSGALPTSNSILIQVSSEAEPLVIIEADKDYLCHEDTVTYTATVSGAGTSPVYQWKKNALPVGNNAPVYVLSQPADNDLITCTVTTAANCKAISNTVLTSVSPCLSVEKDRAHPTLKVYPNPFGETITLELTTTSSTTLTLLEATGKEIRQQQIPATTTFKTDWVLAELPYGMYLLRITDEQTTTVQKLLKQ